MAMTKRKKRLILIISLAILVVAIAFVVIWFFVLKKDNNEEAFERKTLTEVLEEAPDVLGNEYQNLTLPDTIELDTPSVLHTFTVATTDVLTEEETINKCVELSNLFNSYDITKEQVESEILLKGDYISTRYNADNDDENAYSCNYNSDTDFLLWNKYTVMNKTGFGTCKEYYKVGEDDLSSVVYKVDGQDYSAQQALDYANTVVNGEIKSFVGDMEIRPEYVVVSKNDFNSDYSYLIVYAYYYDGIEVNGAGSGAGAHIRMLMRRLTVMIASPDKLCQIETVAGYTTETKDIPDSFITLESALEHTEETLAEYFVHDIQEIDIVYAAVSKSGFQKEFYFKEYRPMWRFTVQDVSTSTNMPSRYCIYVDMIDGAIILYNGTTGEFVSDTYSHTLEEEDYDENLYQP